MASSNPFRSKGSHLMSRFSTASPIDTGSPASTPSPQPPHTSFRTSPEASGSAEKKPKVVKKVRVLSPPPISPDSPEWPSNPAPVYAPNADDPFGNGLYEQTDRDTPPPLLQQPQFPLQLQAHQNAAPPANPFSKTLHDMENVKKEGLKEERRDEGATLKAASKARASLDVNSFQRLLMTGNVDGDGGLGINTTAAQAERPSALERRSSAASSQHTPEDEVSDSSVAVQIGSRKKAPPPPPSSRHGKSIRRGSKELQDGVDTPEAPETGTNAQNSTPNVLSGAVKHQPDAVLEKVMDQDLQSAKKPAPAPPPRRGHSRGESKVTPLSLGGISAKGLQEDDLQSRSSSDSVPTRSNSVRTQSSSAAPAPPPPRRPLRPISLQPSPTSSNFQIPPSPMHAPKNYIDSGPLVSSSDVSLPAGSSTNHYDVQTGHTKGQAPPRPPTRNPSTRRPSSIISMDTPSVSRTVSGESRNRDGAPPPPPPARKRGSSRSSLDGPVPRASVDGTPRAVPSLVEEPHDIEPGHGDSILADLTALQREVDALRGKLE